MRCEACGHDLVVETTPAWTFFVDRKLSSLNAHTANFGGKRWRYGKERDTWKLHMLFAMRDRKITHATEKRRLVLTRVFVPPERQWDYDNLVGGMKPIVDAMRLVSLICDDSPRWLEAEYHQRKAGRGEVSGLEVQVFELGAGASSGQ